MKKLLALCLFFVFQYTELSKRLDQQNKNK